LSRFVTLVWLALRELWISFRLVTLLGAFLLAALPLALVPYLAPQLGGLPLSRLAWYATALAAALAVAAGLAAATLSNELRRGTFAWLAVRAVPRTTLLLAWFLAFGVVLALGVTLSATVTGLSLGVAIASRGIGVFAAACVAVVAAGLAATAIGLLIGTLLRPAIAAAATIVVVSAALLGAAAASGPFAGVAVPTGGLAVLAGMERATRPLADALLASGTALTLAAGVLVVAAASLRRVDL
jgi:ABC-type transport system involved in multi-copper enzyme maturation permease subunit